MASTILNATSVTHIEYIAGSLAWTNPNNVIGSNTGTYAYVEKPIGEISWLVGVTTHDVPAGNDIVGFSARFVRRYIDDSGSNSGGEISLVKNGELVGTPKSLATWSSSLAWSTSQGGGTDMWGATGSRTDTWGLAVHPTGVKYDEFRIAAFELTIYYQLADDAAITWAGVRPKPLIHSFALPRAARY